MHVRWDGTPLAATIHMERRPAGPDFGRRPEVKHSLMITGSLSSRNHFGVVSITASNHSDKFWWLPLPFHVGGYRSKGKLPRGAACNKGRLDTAISLIMPIGSGIHLSSLGEPAMILMKQVWVLACRVCLPYTSADSEESCVHCLTLVTSMIF